jgi:hypothetical protein
VTKTKKTETPKARLEARRNELLRELARITREVQEYGKTDPAVTWGHAGDLSAVMSGLADLHLVGRNYKLECAK